MGRRQPRKSTKQSANKTLDKTSVCGYLYTLVVFKNILINGLLTIDFVPTCWLNFEKNKYQARYLEPTFKNGKYSEDDLELMESFRRICCDAPDSWDLYDVEIRGRAKSYEEAVARVVQLEKEEFAMTTDAEFKNCDPKNGAKPRKKLQEVVPNAIDQEEIDDLFDVPTVAKIVADSSRKQKDTISKASFHDVPKRRRICTLSSSSSDSGENASPVPRPTRSAPPVLKPSTPVPAVTPPFRSALREPSNKSTPAVPTRSQSALSRKSALPQVLPVASVDEAIPSTSGQTVAKPASTPRRPAKKSVSTIETLSLDSNTTERITSACKTFGGPYNGLQPEVNNERDKLKYLSERLDKLDRLDVILDLIIVLSADVKNQKQMLQLLNNKVDNLLKDGTQETYSLQELAVTRELTIPCATMEQFDALNNVLQRDAQFKKKLTLSLLNRLSANVKRSLPVVLRLLFAKNLALNFVAQRTKRESQKTCIKDSCVVLCLFDAFKSRKNDLTLSEFLTNLGMALNNVKDWEGGRANR